MGVYRSKQLAAKELGKRINHDRKMWKKEDSKLTFKLSLRCYFNRK